MDGVVEGASREKDKQEIAALKDYVVKLEDKMSSLHNMVQHFIQRMDVQVSCNLLFPQQCYATLF